MYRNNAASLTEKREQTSSNFVKCESFQKVLYVKLIMAKLTDEEVLQISSEGNTSDFEIDKPEGPLDMFKDFYAGFAQQARQGNEDDNMSNSSEEILENIVTGRPNYCFNS
ncbi:hypothetical protein M8J76_013465 [Diaphorina citri]|nr:hypothetical protein M8J76_013465 [Diaphorina citri]KAI5732005.1 hypothetical protein M8J77_019669 [Diaphorina citri]